MSRIYQKGNHRVFGNANAAKAMQKMGYKDVTDQEDSAKPAAPAAAETEEATIEAAPAAAETEEDNLEALNKAYEEKFGKKATGQWAKNAEWLKKKLA